jgi:hypothetical protein
MQFPVPQFTEVEDKIIGTLTIKQFGIIFAAGVMVFLGYSASKSILVAVFLFVLFGVPALGLAFATINGRPLYNTIGFFIKFMSSPKILVFHKEATGLSSNVKLKDVDLKSKTAEVTAAPSNPQDNLRQVQELLRNTQNQEQELLNKNQG